MGKYVYKRLQPHMISKYQHRPSSNPQKPENTSMQMYTPTVNKYMQKCGFSRQKHAR